jgi:hypothetical protein
MHAAGQHGTTDHALVRGRIAAVRPEEPLRVAIILSVVGGYLDAFTWIAHDGVIANAQTANVVLLGVNVAMGEWAQALRFVPSIAGQCQSNARQREHRISILMTK